MSSILPIQGRRKYGRKNQRRGSLSPNDAPSKVLDTSLPMETDPYPDPAVDPSLFPRPERLLSYKEYLYNMMHMLPPNTVADIEGLAHDKETRTSPVDSSRILTESEYMQLFPAAPPAKPKKSALNAKTFTPPVPIDVAIPIEPLVTTTSGTTTTSTETKADADDTLPLGTQIIPVPSADTTVTCAEVQFTTEQEKWLVKPIDFPTDVWPAVRRMRFTDGKIITTTPEETKLNFGKQHYQDLYGMIFKYLTEKKPPDMVPDGTAREAGENAMIRRTLKSFLETMKAFRYNAKENAVVVLDYGVSKAEKAKFWDEETKMVVVKPIKNPMRQIGTLRQYKVIPESKWEEYMDKIWGDVQKNAHRTSFIALYSIFMKWHFRWSRLSVQQSHAERDRHSAQSSGQLLEEPGVQTDHGPQCRLHGHQPFSSTLRLAARE